MAARKTVCPHCHSAFALNEKLIGKRVKCKKCSSLFVVAEGTGNFIGQGDEEVLVEPLDAPATTFEVPTTRATGAGPAAADPTSASQQPAGGGPPGTQRISPETATTSRPTSSVHPIPGGVHAPPVSPYENLAAQLSSGAGTGVTTAQDYISLNRKYLHEDSRTDSAGGNGRFVFRGMGLMGFGLILFGLSLLNLHLGQMNWLGLVACVISVACGLLGSLMVMIGGRDRVLTGLAFGGLPGLIFLGLAALGVFLGMHDHWGVNGYWSRYSNQMASRPSDVASNQEKAASSSGVASRPPSRRTSRDPGSNLSRPPSRRNSRPSTASDMQEEFQRRVEENQREIDEIFAEARDRMRGTGDSTNGNASRSPGSSRPSNPDRSASAEAPDDDDDPFAQIGDDDIEAIFGADSATAKAESEAMPTESDRDDIVVSVPSLQEDTARYHNVMTRRMKLVSEALRKFKTQAHDLPNEYRTGVKGVDTGNDRYEFFMTSNSRPMLGLDATVDRSGFTNLLPVFDRNEASQSLAREGYAVGGVRLFDDGQYLRGVQLVFMKINGKQLDVQQYYKGPWIGEAPVGQTIQSLSGEGRMIFGVYHTRGRIWANLGLVKNNR